MKTTTQLLSRIRSTFPPPTWDSFPVVVAVSGGADSVALLRLLVLLRQESGSLPSHPLIVAHVNHGLRGEQSDRDEQFVRLLADELDLPLVHKALSGPTRTSEESLRDQRYEFLAQLARESGARLIATGHTANDQVETILFRILRGTGIDGLAGIRPVRVLDSVISIVRPLLNIHRTEIEQSLAELNQPYCLDSTNEQSIYTRNYLRNELIPNLESRFEGRVFDSLSRLGLQAAETASYLNDQASTLHEAILEQTSDGIRLDLHRLAPHPPILIRQFLKTLWSQQNWPLQSMTYDHWQQLGAIPAEAITAPPQSITINLPGAVHCQCDSQSMTLNRLKIDCKAFGNR